MDNIVSYVFHLLLPAHSFFPYYFLDARVTIDSPKTCIIYLTGIVSSVSVKNRLLLKVISSTELTMSEILKAYCLPARQ